MSRDSESEIRPMPDEEKTARFSVGDLVHHRLFDYRGLIYDVDPVFMLSDEWYEQMATSRPPRDEPWYRVLVHNAMHETYVAERNLEQDPDRDLDDPILHPLVDTLFEKSEDGVYRLKERGN